MGWLGLGLARSGGWGWLRIGLAGGGEGWMDGWMERDISVSCKQCEAQGEQCGRLAGATAMLLPAHKRGDLQPGLAAMLPPRPARSVQHNQGLLAVVRAVLGHLHRAAVKRVAVVVEGLAWQEMGGTVPAR